MDQSTVDESRKGVAMDAAYARLLVQLGPDEISRDFARQNLNIAIREAACEGKYYVCVESEGISERMLEALKPELIADGYQVGYCTISWSGTEKVKGECE